MSSPVTNNAHSLCTSLHATTKSQQIIDWTWSEMFRSSDRVMSNASHQITQFHDLQALETELPSAWWRQAQVTSSVRQLQFLQLTYDNQYKLSYSLLKGAGQRHSQLEIKVILTFIRTLQLPWYFAETVCQSDVQRESSAMSTSSIMMPCINSQRSSL